MFEQVISRNPKNFSNQLWSLKDQEVFCDAAIIVNGERINVHAIVLASCSEFFKTKFAESAAKEITFKDVDKEILKELIKYCYTGKIKITENNAQEVFKMASTLSIDSFFESSSATLKKKINVSNCILFWKISKIGKLEQLEKKSLKFVKNNLKLVSQTENFFNLNYAELRELIESGYLGTVKIIFNTMKKWVKHDISRNAYLTDLLDLIDLTLLPREVLAKESLSFCETDEKCSKKFSEAQDLQTEYANNTFCKKLDLTDPSMCNITLAAVGADNSEDANTMEIYDVPNEKWIQINNINSNRYYFATVLLNSKLILIGGYHEVNAIVNTVQSYDIKTGGLGTLSPLKHKRSLLAAVQYKKYIFAIGGTYQNTPLSNVERYDPDLNEWIDVKSLNESRQGLAACVFKDEIYVVGGYNLTVGSVKSVEVYNITDNQWRQRAPMITGRSNPGIAAVMGYLYVAGGFESPTTVERYDPIYDNWKTIHSMGIERIAPAAGNLMGKLVVAGGSLDSEDEKKVNMYDEVKNEWTLMTPLKNVRRIFSLVEIPWALAKHAIPKKV